MCDEVASLTFELCQIQFINASHTQCKISSSNNTIGQWMKYRNLTDGETDLIAWLLLYKAMKHQISKSGF